MPSCNGSLCWATLKLYTNVECQTLANAEMSNMHEFDAVKKTQLYNLCMWCVNPSWEMMRYVTNIYHIFYVSLL